MPHIAPQQSLPLRGTEELSHTFKILSGDTTNCPMRTPEWSTSNRSATPLDKLKVTKWRPLVRNVCNFTPVKKTGLDEGTAAIAFREAGTWCADDINVTTDVLEPVIISKFVQSLSQIAKRNPQNSKFYCLRQCTSKRG